MKLSVLIPLAAAILSAPALADGIDDAIRDFYALAGPHQAQSFSEAPFTSLMDFKKHHRKIVAGMSLQRHFAMLLKSKVNQNTHEQFFRFLDGKDIRHIVNTLGTAGQADFGAHLDKVDGKALSDAGLSRDQVAAILGHANAELKPVQVNKFSAKFVKDNAVAIGENLKKSGVDLRRIREKTLKHLLATREGVASLDRVQVMLLAYRRDLAKLLTSKVVKHINLSEDPQNHGILVRNMPDDAFAQVKSEIHAGWFQYMSEAQIRNFQAKSIKDDGVACRLKLSAVGAQAIAGLTPKLMSRYFAENPTSLTVKSDRLWKRIQAPVFAKLCKHEDFATKVPRRAFRHMTAEQRQIFLDSLGKEEACRNLKDDIFRGKARHWIGLKVSKKCFQSMGEDGRKAAMRFRTIAFGLVDPEHIKDIEAPEIRKWRFSLRRGGKKGKMELSGFCALEILSKNPRGSAYLQSILRNDADEKCREISVDQLRKTPWLQSQVTGECVRHIKEIDASAAKNMDANIWAHLKWSQLKSVHDSFAGLRDNAYKGLSSNKAFAEHACVTKETKKDKKVVTKKSILEKLNADKVRANFASAFINLVPAENRAHLAANMERFGDHILEAGEASIVTELLAGGKVSDAQYGHASDKVEEAQSFPASLTAADVSGLSAGRVGALSASFVSKMKAGSIAAFSASQVQALQPASLVSVCGDKAAAFKHPLSDEQKAHLSRDCPASEKKNEAPCPYSSGSILAVAAALAGGAAALL